MPLPASLRHRSRIAGTLALMMIFMGSTVPLPAQRYRISSLSTADGLPDNTIQTIHQDQQGFLWLGTPKGLVRYDGYHFQTFNPRREILHLDSLQSAEIDVLTIEEELSGDLLIGCTFDNISQPSLFRFHMATESFEVFHGSEAVGRLFEESPSWLRSVTTHRRGAFVLSYDWLAFFDKRERDSMRVFLPEEGDVFQQIFRAADSQIWVMGIANLYRFDAASIRLHPFPLPIQAGKQLMVRSMGELPDGGLWLWGGEREANQFQSSYLEFDPKKEQFTRYNSLPTSTRFPGRAIRLDQHTLWEAYPFGLGGMAEVDLDNLSSRPIEFQNDTDRHLSDQAINCLYRDRSGMVWMGSQRQGLFLYDPYQNQFKWLRHEVQARLSLEHDYVTDLSQAEDGTIWIATVGGGIHRWDHPAGNIQVIPNEAGNISLAVEATRSGEIWFDQGFSLKKYQPATGSVNVYPEGSSTHAIHEDRTGNVWFTKYSGLWRYDAAADTLIWIPLPAPGDPSRRIRFPVAAILVASDGTIWLAGFSSDSPAGLMQYQPATDQIRYHDLPLAYAFAEDLSGTIWIGTQSGLFTYAPHQDRFEQIALGERFDNIKISALVLDQRNRLWIAHSHGISCYYIEADSIKHYAPGKRIGENTYCSLLDATGWVYFAGKAGICYFHPDSLRDNHIAPQLAITEIAVNNEPLSIDPAGQLPLSPGLTDAITLAHDQNDLTIRYAGLHFQNPPKNRYRIWLKHFDETWRDVGTRTEATYTNLDPGDYVFHFQAANSDGVWSEQVQTLRIRILAPWYWHIWSQLSYLALLLGLGYAFYRFQLQRKLALADARRLAEIDQLKSRFYTNITHEFRTPLTNILGMNARIRHHEQEREVIQRNTQQLLDLVNQMLDLSKLEVARLQLNLQLGDVVPYLNYVTEAFHSSAIVEGVTVSFFSHEASIVMDHDPERLRQVVANLISNAIKFTPEYGKVQVILRTWAQNDQGRPAEIPAGDLLEIQVQDSGAGMPVEQLDHIFDRFYQGESDLTRRAEGTGIGLALCQELVKLMQGQIQVSSRPGEGSIFRVLLPITQAAASVASPASKPASQQLLATGPASPAPSTAADTLLVLVVEDNRDVRSYLASCLRDCYRLAFANNGREGIAKATQLVPDLIISDVMMPEVDGLTLCRSLKQDQRTSHIPIILLTARATLDNKLEGLETGADAYLVKPFSEEELFIRLGQLHALRQRLRQRFAIGALPAAPERQDLDTRFLNRLNQFLHQHLADPSLSVADIAEEMAMSRMQLHRKVKALTGQAPARYLRTIRLHHARELIQRTDLSIGEIADKVGYTETAHFSRAYKGEFQRPPSAEG